MPQIKRLRMRKQLARVMVRPPTRPSAGARTIRKLLGSAALLVRKDYAPKQYRWIINWGNATPFDARGKQVFNPPNAVAVAVNKLLCFKALKDAGVRIPNFVEKNPSQDRLWFARTKLASSCGDGIVVIRPDDVKGVDAPLYVEYIKKTEEYRVHVVNGNAIFVQQKKKRAGFEQDKDEKLIRNHDNGWVFCIADSDEVQDDVKHQAIKAVAAAGLHFGAVDIVVGRDDGLAYVLEINTAPGITSPTLEQAYKEALTQLVV